MSKLLTSTEVVQAIQDGKKVEYRHPHLDWTILKPTKFKLSKLLESEYQFRLAQEMVSIGDVSFIKPASEPLKDAEQYWVADPTDADYTTSFTWIGDNFDKLALSRGLVHRSKENAIAHAKALIKLSGGQIE